MFKTAYVVQNTHHDFEPLRKIATDIVFITDGYEQEDKLKQKIENALTNFYPAEDVIVPVGNVLSNMLVGAILLMRWHYIQVAIFRDKEYHVREINDEATGYMEGDDGTD